MLSCSYGLAPVRTVVVDLHTAGGVDALALLGPYVALAGVLGYLYLAVTGSRPWPVRRSVLWVVGSAAVTLSISGPLADAADEDFTAHMATHLLLGMVGPLLLVLAAPVTVLLRWLPARAARRLSRVLTCRPLAILTEPAVAAVLSVGGLWVLYTTALYPAMHHQPVVHLLVHAHLFIGGYLFVVAMISVDPLPHRRSYRHRSAVLILSLAAHDVLAKYLYGHPPLGVAGPAAESGSLLMYYGGDAVEVVVMIILCHRWYRSRRPRRGSDRPDRLNAATPRRQQGVTRQSPAGVFRRG